jgi:hypothetical protein
LARNGARHCRVQLAARFIESSSRLRFGLDRIFGRDVTA